MSQAKVTATPNGPILEVKISGYVGENSGLYDFNYRGITTIAVDVSGVNYINSVGVKQWIHWTGRFPKELIVQFHKCPALIINQVNMVAGFLPRGGTVESLSAPFICEDCNREETILLHRPKDFDYATGTEAYKYVPPTVPCPKCKKPMELDAMETKFFGFLKQAKPT